MSINVTVSGNPIRINRGKMVTAYDPAKTEFEKRRLMRLEQVRQQSKNIAENLRNKIKKQKSQCQSEVEKDGEIKLKNWQARKLLELQDQYQEALDEIGLGHKDAVRVQDEEEDLEEQREENERAARDRGRAAVERLQIQRNEESLRKAVPRQRRVFTSDMEKRRAVAVRSGKKGKSPNKKKKEFDEDGENKVPQLEGLEEEDGMSWNSEEEVRRKRSDETEEREQQTLGGAMSSKEQQTSATLFQIPTSDKAAQTSLYEDPQVIPPSTRDFFLDTRISERIKRRSMLNSGVDYCDILENAAPTKSTICTCCKCPTNHPHALQAEITDFRRKEPPQQLTVAARDDKTETTPKSEAIIPENSETLFEGDPEGVPTGYVAPQNSLLIVEDDKTKAKIKSNTLPVTTKKTIAQRPGTALGTKKREQSKTQSTIPAKPRVTLRPTKNRPVYIGMKQKVPVQLYDHPNRYTKSFIPKTSHVEKIEDQEVVVSPEILSEEEIRERMRQRDIEAHVRGQAAIEKERIHREYRDLLKKLPALQKQERIFEIGTDKERYHMSKERLDDLEKRRQNRLDNAYEELFVRQTPAVVTLHRRKDKDEDHSLNLADWDVDFDPDGCSRSQKLSQLLDNLKRQKETLLKEIESTLSKEKLTQSTKSTDDVKSKSTDYTRSKKRKRTASERPVSPTSTNVSGEESDTRTKSTKKGTPASSPSPRKKPKTSKVLVLQNSSTQTTPVLETQNAVTSPILKTETGQVCPCVKDAVGDVCEIVIKIKEDEKPQVEVRPLSFGKSVKVVTEGIAAAKKDSPKKSTSWRDQLIQSSSSHSSSSTTYLEPPSSAKSKEKSLEDTSRTTYLEPASTKKENTPDETSKEADTSKKSTKSEDSRGSSHRSADISRSLRSTGPDGRIDPRLLTYIRKLLDMSRANIDELTVSTASEVSTPSHSVIETPSNNPLLQLINVMKYFDLDVAEVQKQLSYVSDDSSRRYNTSESTTLTSTASEKSEFKSCTDIVEHPNKNLLHYADVAASCTEKINNLTAMIEKVRAEKKKMLETSTSGSEKDLTTTTSYKDLPEKKAKDEATSPADEVDKLLRIDHDYADRLKRLSHEEIQIAKDKPEDPSDNELMERLQKLLNDSRNRKTVGEVKDKNIVDDFGVKSMAGVQHRTVVETKDKKVVQDFGAQPVAVTSQKKSVETSDGKRTAGTVVTKTTVRLAPEQMKHSEEKEVKSPKEKEKSSAEKEPEPLFLDIPKLPRLEPSSLGKKKKRPPPSKGMRLVPGIAHELSTIIEADSQITTKGESLETKDSSKSQSSDDVSEMDTMETMLVSIGMEWAIPTLKKTREALAMSSSSSGSKESGEVSLKEFLSKISSSSNEGSMLSESQGISLIQVDNRRTSTPIVDNEKKEGPIFVTDTDVSSVRENSDRKESDKFYDLNDGSVSKSR